MVANDATANEQKSLGAFFQKRTASFARVFSLCAARLRGFATGIELLKRPTAIFFAYPLATAANTQFRAAIVSCELLRHFDVV
jgi:hypothetical protein